VRLLLDTHTLLWFGTNDRRLGRRAVAAMQADDVELYVSVATVWELAIKKSARRLTLDVDVERYIAERLEQGYRLLPIAWTHAARVEHLPFHHRDPFDRVLAAQALAEQMPCVTRDRVFRKYGVQTIW
jgi:PIN domain nuclease of toxin-antitoxin system